MLEEKKTEQIKLATQKGKNSLEKFGVGDKVILQETTGRRGQWIDKGLIREPRISDDRTCHSFIVDLDKGGQYLRNKRFLKHHKNVTFINRNAGAVPDPPNMNTRSKG